MIAHLIRYCEPTQTRGIMIAGDLQFEILELVWDGNKQNISCIPDGVYPYFLETSTKRDHPVIELIGVKGRSQIQQHYGPNLKWSNGCQLHPTVDGERIARGLMGKSGYLHIKTINNEIFKHN